MPPELPGDIVFLVLVTGLATKAVKWVNGECKYLYSCSMSFLTAGIAGAGQALSAAFDAGDFVVSWSSPSDYTQFACVVDQRAPQV